ncbi:MAG: hypothetical protein AB7D00_12205 [Rhodospirillaceae bacterium]
MSEPILEARGLSYDYPGGIPALSGLDLTVARGRRLAIQAPTARARPPYFCT